MLKSEQRIHFRLADLKRKDKQLSRDFFHVASPIVAHEIIWSFGTSAGSMITGQMGTAPVAGFSVTTVLYDLCASVGNGFLNASSVVIGKTIGSGDRERVKSQARTILLIGLCMGFVLGTLTFFVRTPFLSLYNLEPDAAAYARQFMMVYAFIWPFIMLEYVGMIAILRAGGDGKTGFYTDIVAMWLTTIPMASVAAFVLHWPPVVVVAIVKTTIIIEAVVGVIRVLSMKWIKDLTRG